MRAVSRAGELGRAGADRACKRRFAVRVELERGQVVRAGDAAGKDGQWQAGFMGRCGFDSFAPAYGSSPADWAHAAGRFRHVYQRGADARAPVFEERAQHGL